jgi:putative IMPACT (imprinted ancient) family translation regulator
MPPKRPASPIPGVNIFTSSPIIDRQSTFIAHYSPTISPKTLQSLPECKDASHRILAWRLPSKQQTLTPTRPIFDAGHDDDGEQWAGKKLETLMEQLNLQGAIVVARWYGGVLLGPVRFKHIEDCAKEAVNLWRNPEQVGKRQRTDTPLSSDQTSSQPRTPLPVMRPEELQRKKQDLIRTLHRRDESVATLRTLLEEKKGLLQNTQKPQQSSSAGTKSSPVAKVDYEAMPLARLLALEQARDASLTFLLKEIDRIEKQVAEREATEAEKKQSETALNDAADEEEMEEAWRALADNMLMTAQAETPPVKTPKT